MSNVRHPTGYEQSDADPRLLAYLAVGIAAFLFAAPLVLLVSYPQARHEEVLPLHIRQPPLPRLQTEPRSDLDRLRSYEHEQLEGFGWSDRERDYVRIPIDRAMQLLAERGLPGWPSTTAAAESGTPTPR